MKLTAYFADFLNDTVNLNQTRVDDLEKSIGALQGFIEGSEWAAPIREWMAQGSWAHKTIIKPVDSGEFDADLLVFVKPVEGWTAADYINTLYKEFLGSTVYKDKVARYSHCVTITYANDKKIDIAPCVVNRGGFDHLEVCNRDSEEFEEAAPRAYTEWLKTQNGLSGNHSFRKVTRLLKYLRDIKTTFTCSSVLLTTLLGSHIYSTDKDSAAFADTPTALKTLLGRLDDYLQNNYWKPAVRNPFLYSEDFAASLSQAQYENFRTVIHRYRGWVDEAYAEQDAAASLTKWQRIFGEDFEKSVTTATKSADSVSNVAAMLRDLGMGKQLMGVVKFSYDVVQAVSAKGLAALPMGFANQPQRQIPTWPVSSGEFVYVHVEASIFTMGKSLLGSIQNGQPNQPKQRIRFQAVGMDGKPLDPFSFDVKWRITNTGDAAFINKGLSGLRGGFEISGSQNERWETMDYRGVHMAEAFVIDRKTGLQVGLSNPFYVTIE